MGCGGYDEVRYSSILIQGEDGVEKWGGRILNKFGNAIQ